MSHRTNHEDRLVAALAAELQLLDARITQARDALRCLESEHARVRGAILDGRWSDLRGVFGVHEEDVDNEAGLVDSLRAQGLL